MRAVKHWDCLEDLVSTLEQKEETTIQDYYLFVVLMLELCNPASKNKKIGGALTKIIKKN